MDAKAHSPEDRVIIFGSTGFAGSRLLPELTKKNVRLRLFVRDKAKASAIVADNKDVEIFQCDLVSGKGLKEALQGIHSAYYLVHSMGERAYSGMSNTLRRTRQRQGTSYRLRMTQK